MTVLAITADLIVPWTSFRPELLSNNSSENSWIEVRVRIQEGTLNPHPKPDRHQSLSGKLLT